MIQEHLVKAALEGICQAFDREPEYMEEWQNPQEFTTGQGFTDFLHLFTARLILESEGFSIAELMQE